MKHPGGRPTKYKEEYCKEIIQFFDIENTREVEKVFRAKDGKETVTYEEVSNELPTFEKFAHKIGVHIDTLHEWCKVHKQFSESYKRCQQLQKQMVINNGLRGFYNPTFSIFFSKNNLGMKDKNEVETSGTQTLTIQTVDYTKE